MNVKYEWNMNTKNLKFLKSIEIQFRTVFVFFNARLLRS